MDLEEKVVKRRLLLGDIRKKKIKLQKMSSIINRNLHEYHRMIKEHNKLDREIFIEKNGITIIEAKRSKNQLTSAQLLSEAFIDSLSDDARKRLLDKLTKSMEKDQK